MNRESVTISHLLAPVLHVCTDVQTLDLCCTQRHSRSI